MSEVSLVVLTQLPRTVRVKGNNEWSIVGGLNPVTQDSKS